MAPELGQVVSGSAAQGFWLGDRKLPKIEADLLRKEQLGNLGEGEEEPATERSKACTDLEEKDEQVACHASAMALAMTDEACLETKM